MPLDCLKYVRDLALSTFYDTTKDLALMGKSRQIKREASTQTMILAKFDCLRGLIRLMRRNGASVLFVAISESSNDECGCAYLLPWLS